MNIESILITPMSFPVIQIDRAAFERWLDQFNPEDDCFESRNCTRCPLAVYLQELHLGKSVIVTDSGAVINGIFHAFDNESWEPRFIRLLEAWQRINSAAVRKILKLCETP